MYETNKNSSLSNTNAINSFERFLRSVHITYFVLYSTALYATSQISAQCRAGDVNRVLKTLGARFFWSQSKFHDKGRQKKTQRPHTGELTA